MAYLIFSSGSNELSRRPLVGSLVIGRSPECDVSVRDITLSRRHVSIEQDGSDWIAVDLESKNGTTYAGERITRHTLRDSDVIRIGKTLLTFRTGSLKNDISRPQKQQISLRRPVDPIEALAGTVTAMVLQPEVEVQARRAPGARPFPKPLPRPADPAYEDDEVYDMVHGLVSSSWDSIYLTVSRDVNKKNLPRPMVAKSGQRMRTSAPQVDIDLQAIPERRPPEKVAPIAPIDWRRRLMHAAHHIAKLGRWAALITLVRIAH